MQLRYTILYVEDVNISMTFFEQAFDLQRAMLHEGGDYGELATGTTRLAFSSIKLMQELGKSPGQPDVQAPIFELAFETDDVASALKRATDAGASLVQDAQDQPWGQTIAYVSSPEGYLIEICTPVTGPDQAT